MSIETKKCERCGKNKTMFSWDTICWECQQDIELESIKAKIKEAKDDEEVNTSSNSYVICPYCGEAFDVCDISLDDPDIMCDGDHLLECPDCGKEFILSTSVFFYYETYKKDKKESTNV